MVLASLIIYEQRLEKVFLVVNFRTTGQILWVFRVKIGEPSDFDVPIYKTDNYISEENMQTIPTRPLLILRIKNKIWVEIVCVIEKKQTFTYRTLDLVVIFSFQDVKNKEGPKS